MQKLKFIKGACGKPFFLPNVAGSVGEFEAEQAAKLIELKIAIPYTKEMEAADKKKAKATPKKK